MIGQVTDYKTLSRAVMGSMKPGRFTNLFWGKADYEQAIAAGLYQIELPGGLALLEQRPGFYRLRYITDGKAPIPPQELPIITETVFRPGKEPLLPDFLQASAWSCTLERLRLTRPAGGSAAAPLGRLAAPSEEEALFALLTDSFDPMTGCLPTREEWSREIEAKNIFCFYKGDTPLGLLHFKTDEKKAEIRHLAVAKTARRQGIGGQLLIWFIARFGPLPCTVWTGKKNAAALALYQKYGFQPDGWTSAVYISK